MLASTDSFRKLKDSTMWHTTSTWFIEVMVFIIMTPQCVVLVLGLGSQGITDIFLNSPNHCGKEITVQSKGAYLITPNMDPGNSSSTFLPPNNMELCGILFKSSATNGSICIAQAGPISHLNAERESSDYIRLRIYDGKDKSTVLNGFQLDNGRQSIGVREGCTSQENLYFSLLQKMTPPDFEINISKVELAFQVFDVGNKHRMLFLDEEYTSGVFKMQNSWLSVYNRVPLSFKYYTTDTHGNQITNIFRPNSIGVTTRKNSICVALMPLDNWNCESSWNWTLIVATQPSVAAAHRLATRQCTLPPAERMMRECWNRTSLTLIMSYVDYDDYFTTTGPKEPLNMFRIVVTDLVDTVDELNKELEKEKNRESRPAKPVLSADPASGSFYDGSKVTLTCTTTTAATDGIKYIFSRDGAEDMEAEGASKKYVIENYSTASHAGSYTCMVAKYHAMMYLMSDRSEPLVVNSKGRVPTTPQTSTTTKKDDNQVNRGSPYMSTSPLLLAMSAVTTLFVTTMT